ncbi:hypothetical protein INS49_006763 [Diaporthe citri]|uniref:uncharacterized protein n=1 Tax=Diaporthe citri TaxID=83186 RepID=UPI001C7E4D8A|nr:uncharacterized protein INS49_006763 [Diaporthe citri]KAG6365156.1 hypothetical protein INS49_006763 [Diaporthe citri]
MDDYFFKNHVKACRNVSEDTSYLEIFNYSDPSYNTVEQHPLTMDEFDNFLKRKGAFAPPKLKDGVKLLNGCRIVLQLKVKHPETFAPQVISFTGPEYENMVRSLHLPYRAIEGTAVVGPFFWCSKDSDDDDDPYQQIIMRKSDVRKKGKTRGWELMLSHHFRTGVTTGYVKGTDSSDMTESIQHLKECASHMAHPFLLPVIILSHDLSPKTDSKQRDARDWLRRLEHAVSMRNEIQEEEGYVKADVMDLDQINRDLVECHSQVLWKRPQAYQEIITAMEEGMEKFVRMLPPERGPLALEDGGRDLYGYRDLRKQQSSMLSRLEFYYNKLKGTEHYVHTTLERLAIQRSALYNIIAQKESKLNLQMAGDQRRLAYASKRDSTSMKTISLLGSIFLPATLLASIFSMTFFNFQNGLTENDDGPVVAPTFWIYWAVAIPITLFIVIIWWIWDRSREARYAKEDDDLEANIEHMEKNIMKTMRQRTMSKVRTWTHAPEKVE